MSTRSASEIQASGLQCLKPSHLDGIKKYTPNNSAQRITMASGALAFQKCKLPVLIHDVNARLFQYMKIDISRNL